MTYEELIAFWNERDGRYATRKHMGRVMRISPEEESSIIASRRAEVDRYLVRTDRLRALVVLSNWSRPLAAH